MRSMVEGAERRDDDRTGKSVAKAPYSCPAAAPSTAFGGPPPPRFAQGRMLTR